MEQDKDIIENLQTNDEQGYEMMIDKYTSYVSTIVYNMTHTILSVSDMEELVADVFFKIWLSRSTLKGESLKGILIVTSRNICIDAFKKNKKLFVPLDDDAIQITSKDNIHSIQEQNEQMNIVNQNIEKFEEPDKEIFIRFYYFGEKINQIAEFLKLNSSTVKTKLRRGKERLCKALNEGGYYYE